MDSLSAKQASRLEQCLEALETGATVEECLAQHAGEADALRPLLDLRAGLLAQEPPPPPAHAYQAGRQALVEALHAREAPAAASSLPRPLAFLAGIRWHSLRAAQAPLARVAAVLVAAALVGVGTLGASAAGGFEPARDVLSALRIIDNPRDGTPADQDGSDGEDEGGSVPPAGPDLAPEQDGTEDLPGGAPCETPDFLERLRDILDDTPAAGPCDGDELDGQQPETTPGGPPADKPPATPGPPDHANPRNPTPPEPPVDAPRGPGERPDDRPSGPPDDRPGAPPEDRPGRPPDDGPTGVPQGPSGGVPQGDEEGEGGPPAEPGQQGDTPQAEPGRPDGAGNAAPR